MDKPNRATSHILETKSKKYLEANLPDEWHYNVPNHDYGIDYQVEISINQQVSGLNFSIQLKSTQQTGSGTMAKVALKRSTLAYYNVRLEPVMLIIYDTDAKEAYWSWMAEFDVDLSKDNKTYSLAISKGNKLSEIDWAQIADYVQHIFNAKSYISDFDLLKIDNNIELAAWKVYYEADYEQAVYLFKRLINTGINSNAIQQALAWSLYQLYQYTEALNVIDALLEIYETPNLLQTKACILAEYGFRDQDKGKIIQARNLFKKFSEETGDSLMYFNYGNTLNELGDGHEAIKQYKISLNLNPNNAQCWKNLGTTYYGIGEHDQEIICYDTALSLDPDLPQALFSKGVTLAQHYARYEEALSLFHKVLDRKNSLIQGYVNGLFWVAYCYQEIGDLTLALFWIDKGLNHQGTNPYFLNFKSNLLGRNWQNSSELKEKAIEFFEYRIELENDSRSLYHYILIKEYDLKEALVFLKDKAGLYKNLQLDDLNSISFSLDNLMTTLLQFDYYLNFREKYPVTRYLDRLISPHFSIDSRFFDLLDLVFSLSFNQAIKTYGSTKELKELLKAILDVILVFIPKLIPFLISKEDYDETAIDEIMMATHQGYTEVVFREIGAQSGHITVNLDLRKVDPSEYITDEFHEALSKGIYDQFIEQLP